ncbi:MAG: hypothetical protein V2I37_08650 [Marinilabiliaceae bacterium]|jgi:hypothetical protein|nr:hypothetical protein [Marinilabiliaceae bacterium]
MNKNDLTQLALKSLTEEISESDRKVIEAELLKDQSFGPGFRDRVLESIYSGSLRPFFDPGNLSIFNRVFNRLALTGMIAIILLIVTLFISQGSLSFDTLIGIDSEMDEGMLSLLIE